VFVVNLEGVHKI